MTELIYNIFNDATRKITNTSTVYNNANTGIGRIVGKGELDGPMKPQGAIKKSFLSNAGKPLQGTPLSQKTLKMKAVPTPFYNDVDSQQICFEELEFTRPPYKLDNYHLDIFEDSFEIDVEIPSFTPPPKNKNAIMEFMPSYDEDFFKEESVEGMELVLEDDLPKIY